MVDEKILESREDIFMLDHVTVVGFPKNPTEIDVDALKQKIAKNKNDYNCWLNFKMEVPELFLGLKPIVNEFKPAEGQNIFCGVAASPGRVQGKACVLDTGDKLEDGQILVTLTTDPAWTPLFLRAGGIAVQHGGILSHGAITAREFCLPAVLGVKGLLTMVKHGDTIIVDGGKGTIEILKEGEEKEKEKEKEKEEKK